MSIRSISFASVPAMSYFRARCLKIEDDCEITTSLPMEGSMKIGSWPVGLVPFTFWFHRARCQGRASRSACEGR
eukprot:297423-Rhodomonas_salina.1